MILLFFCFFFFFELLHHSEKLHGWVRRWNSEEQPQQGRLVSRGNHQSQNNLLLNLNYSKFIVGQVVTAYTITCELSCGSLTQAQ